MAFLHSRWVHATWPSFLLMPICVTVALAVRDTCAHGHTVSCTAHAVHPNCGFCQLRNGALGHSLAAGRCRTALVNLDALPNNAVAA